LILYFETALTLVTAETLVTEPVTKEGGDEVFAPWKNLQLLLGLILDLLESLSSLDTATSELVAHACISVDAIQQQPTTRIKEYLAK
jgi:hypothetical protein